MARTEFCGRRCAHLTSSAHEGRHDRPCPKTENLRRAWQEVTLVRTHSHAFKDILTGADVNNHGVAGLPRAENIRAARERFLSFRDLLEFGFRQAYRGRRIRRNLDGDGQLAVRDFPARRHAAVQALDRSVREGQPTARLRLNQNMFVTGVALVELNACNDAVDPFADCAVGVVVEGIHPRILKTAVGLDAVPSFPDRRGAFGDRIKPGRILDRKSTRLNSSHGYISYAVF